ncbi:Hypothetical protein FKW44_020615 [Caligus rogercresseyi]|uniref:Uncharacterized protein n=1 Tax=Caligus rogercresseyi TaxID=217165 RepID=A0A7T8GXJ8_CALRO|nr:Hypothetical protein FKW44_020615 [Caligus rogercresseyi]
MVVCSGEKYVIRKTLENKGTIAIVKCLIENNPRITTRQVATEVSLSQNNRFQAFDGGSWTTKRPVLVLPQLYETNKESRDSLARRDIEQVKQSPISPNR